MALITRIKNAWNAFLHQDIAKEYWSDSDDYSYSYRPDRLRLLNGSDK